MKTQIHTFDNGDQLILEETTGYAPDPDQTIYRVMYGEKTTEDFDGGQVKGYNSWAMELFTKSQAAEIAFDERRLADDPTKESTVVSYRLKPETLADILADALAK